MLYSNIDYLLDMILHAGPWQKLATFLCILTLSSFHHSVFANNQKNAFEEIEWIDLMPKGDLDALMNPPEILFDIADGSSQDSVDVFSDKELADPVAKRFQQALTSTEVISTFDGKPIRIPGFIVPIENTQDLKVTEFFIVPYFGACLHLPPPPPNQIIHVIHEQGIALERLDDAFWFEGVVQIKTFENDTGTAAYSLALNQAYLFE